MTIKQLKEVLMADSYSKRNGVFTVRKGFFYTHGRSAGDFMNEVTQALPNAIIKDFGEHRTSFRGGASVANSSHWFVKFTI